MSAPCEPQEHGIRTVQLRVEATALLLWEYVPLQEKNLKDESPARPILFTLLPDQLPFLHSTILP